VRPGHRRFGSTVHDKIKIANGLGTNGGSDIANGVEHGNLRQMAKDV
jgi:hypothetical protein